MAVEMERETLPAMMRTGGSSGTVASRGPTQTAATNCCSARAVPLTPLTDAPQTSLTPTPADWASVTAATMKAPLPTS